jgi:hypothetical protein
MHPQLSFNQQETLHRKLFQKQIFNVHMVTRHTKLLQSLITVLSTVLLHAAIHVYSIIIITGMTALCEPWPSSGFLNNFIFMVWGCQPQVQPPTWRTRISLFVWLLPLDLSSLGGPTSSYVTTGIAIRVSGALKPHHHDKVGTFIV